MSVVFLHTADWQLGKPFATVRDDAKRHRLQQERLHAVQRLADIAKSSDADFILIAGDMFDSSHATKATVSAACAAIGTLKIPVLVTRDQISKSDTIIRDLHQQTTAARQALQPAEEIETSLTAAEQFALAASKSAEGTLRDTAEAVRQIRLHHDLAAATATAFERSETHQRLADRTAEADTLRTEITDLRAKLSQVPPLTAKDLASLRNLERESSQAVATLAAIATGIELLQTDSTVALDGKSLAAGEARILTDICELAIGTGTRLRIRPGGGGSLADARLRAESAQNAWSTALARHTLRDLDHATTVFEQRQTLEQQITQLETRWKALGGETLPSELAAATTALAAANAVVQRRQEILSNDPELKSPATLAAARDLVSTTREKLTAAEAAEATARSTVEQSRTRHDAATQAIQDHRAQLTTARQTLRDLETSIKVLEDTHGDATARQLALTQATQHAQAATDQLAITRAALSTLAPDSLSADLDRFTRAITQQETRRREAENQRLIARDRLTLDGSSDPEADVSHAQARCQAARELHSSELRRAKAIEKLHLLFSSSREAIDRSLVQPLADRISGYLRCLFGPGTEVRVNLSDTGIEGLDLIRPGDPAFSFATLSGGAKEQVAAASRLAMAEILATDHDGTLPILFDDAFAYTDPERIQSLQRMLDFAAVRGLQIIILTCTPADYSAFGAGETRLASV